MPLPGPIAPFFSPITEQPFTNWKHAPATWGADRALPFAGGIASFFLGLNRGKSGISINLKQPEGLDLMLASARHDRRACREFSAGVDGQARPGLCHDSSAESSSRLLLYLGVRTAGTFAR